ncbi:hypothetical protein AYI70_g1154 [Smittium culicis]|uniref:Uncharacterized protein n=1 Tax=Smittium culicis TaxID=133412 RepID=A0A1R1YE34_9FUNG|nr:hypothetical protein AYI70_g1154 [Smittium culicis]
MRQFAITKTDVHPWIVTEYSSLFKFPCKLVHNFSTLRNIDYLSSEKNSVECCDDLTNPCEHLVSHKNEKYNNINSDKKNNTNNVCLSAAESKRKSISLPISQEIKDLIEIDKSFFYINISKTIIKIYYSNTINLPNESKNAIFRGVNDSLFVNLNDYLFKYLDEIFDIDSDSNDTTKSQNDTSSYISATIKYSKHSQSDSKAYNIHYDDTYIVNNIRYKNISSIDDTKFNAFENIDNGPSSNLVLDRQYASKGLIPTKNDIESKSFNSVLLKITTPGMNNKKKLSVVNDDSLHQDHISREKPPLLETAKSKLTPEESLLSAYNDYNMSSFQLQQNINQIFEQQKTVSLHSQQLLKQSNHNLLLGPTATAPAKNHKFTSHIRPNLSVQHRPSELSQYSSNITKNDVSLNSNYQELNDNIIKPNKVNPYLEFLEKIKDKDFLKENYQSKKNKLTERIKKSNIKFKSFDHTKEKPPKKK